MYKARPTEPRPTRSRARQERVALDADARGLVVIAPLVLNGALPLPFRLVFVLSLVCRAPRDLRTHSSAHAGDSSAGRTAPGPACPARIVPRARTRRAGRSARSTASRAARRRPRRRQCARRPRTSRLSSSQASATPCPARARQRGVPGEVSPSLSEGSHRKGSRPSRAGAPRCLCDTVSDSLRTCERTTHHEDGTCLSL